MRDAGGALLRWSEVEPYAMALIGDDLGVVWANKSTERLLAGQCLLTSRNKCLTVDNRRGHDAITAFFARVETESVHIVVAQPPLSHVVLRVSPLPNFQQKLFAVFFREAKARNFDLTSLTAAFSLTRTEVKVLEKFMAGHSKEELSIQLGIAAATVRTHFRNIFSKMHVTRRSELMALLHNFVFLK